MDGEVMILGGNTPILLFYLLRLTKENPQTTNLTGRSAHYFALNLRVEKFLCGYGMCCDIACA
jgi:hypothetical protein